MKCIPNPEIWDLQEQKVLVGTLEYFFTKVAIEENKA